MPSASVPWSACRGQTLAHSNKTKSARLSVSRPSRHRPDVLEWLIAEALWKRDAATVQHFLASLAWSPLSAAAMFLRAELSNHHYHSSCSLWVLDPLMCRGNIVQRKFFGNV